MAERKIRSGSAFDGFFFKGGSTVAKNEKQELFAHDNGTQQNGYTAANGFSAGKPSDVNSGLLKKVDDNERRVVTAVAVNAFPADVAGGLKGVRDTLRFNHLFLKFEHAGEHQLGRLQHWPGGSGVADSNFIAGSTSTTEVIANNGAPGASGGVRNVRKLAQPITLEPGEKFEIWTECRRAYPLATDANVEVEVELLGHLEVITNGK